MKYNGWVADTWPVFSNILSSRIVGNPNLVFVTIDKLCRFARGRILLILNHVMIENLLALDPTIICKNNFIDLCYKKWSRKVSVSITTAKLILHKHKEILDNHAAMNFLHKILRITCFISLKCQTHYEQNHNIVCACGDQNYRHASFFRHLLATIRLTNHLRNGKISGISSCNIMMNMLEHRK